MTLILNMEHRRRAPAPAPSPAPVHVPSPAPAPAPTQEANRTSWPGFGTLARLIDAFMSDCEARALIFGGVASASDSSSASSEQIASQEGVPQDDAAPPANTKRRHRRSLLGSRGNDQPARSGQHPTSGLALSTRLRQQEDGVARRALSVVQDFTDHLRSKRPRRSSGSSEATIQLEFTTCFSDTASYGGSDAGSRTDWEEACQRSSILSVPTKPSARLIFKRRSQSLQNTGSTYCQPEKPRREYGKLSLADLRDELKYVGELLTEYAEWEVDLLLNRCRARLLTTSDVETLSDSQDRDHRIGLGDLTMALRKLDKNRLTMHQLQEEMQRRQRRVHFDLSHEQEQSQAVREQREGQREVPRRRPSGRRRMPSSITREAAAAQNLDPESGSTV
ncbi:unnamed protein product [Sympodiomycopsis kandeliae]